MKIPGKKNLIISRYLLVLAVVVLITYLMPKEIQFKYEFEQGKPWKYENLLAPFDFSIIRTEAEIAEEREQIKDDFIPYYEKQPGVLERVKKGVRDRFSQLYPEWTAGDTLPDRPVDPAQTLLHLMNVIDSIYAQGVIRLDSSHQAYTADRPVFLLTGNQRQKKALRDFIAFSRLKSSAGNWLQQEYREQLPYLDDLLKTSLEPDVLYKKSTSETALQAELDKISLRKGKVNRGEKIIYTGEIVNPEKYQVLSSLKAEFQKYTSSYQPYIIFGGHFILVAIVFILFTIFLLLFARDVFKKIRRLTFVLLLICVPILLTIYGVRQDFPSLYIIPYCIIPIVLRTFFGARLAFHAHLSMVLIASLVVPYGIEFLFIQTVAGLVAIFANLKAHYWSQFFASIAYIFLAYLLSYVGVSMIQEGNLQDLDWTHLAWLGGNVFFTFLAYPLIPIFEKLFGVVSEITLIELADFNKPLLKELSLKAPGTSQHSLMVANLSEAAAAEIGANPLLVKVGALYHDIGKMEEPLYFIENQNTDVNPHDELPFEESAKKIIRHVTRGVELAKKYRLPDVIVDFIKTHHGTSRVEYFYQSFLKNYPDQEIDEQAFRYPGPLPFSKETAILMLADSVEAASKSLKSHTEESIDKLVDKIFQHKIDQQQLIKADVTFKDINNINKLFKKMLKSIYHVRVAYPEAQEKESRKAEAPGG